MAKKASAKLGRGERLVVIAALLSLVVALHFWFQGDQLTGIFVGIWVPSILNLGALFKK